jgi:mono/diheme cytochrome c family protein
MQRAACWVAFLVLGGVGPTGATGQEAAAVDRVAWLYRRHCAVCHGERGDGGAPLGLDLYPRPRAFDRGQFRLVRTAQGLPAEDDLMGVLRRGMPGSSMPSFAWLAEADRLALARHVLAIAVDGLVRAEVDAARQQGQAVDPAVVRSRAQARWSAATVLAAGAPAALDEATLQRGRGLYRLACASCHGEDGKGKPRPAGWSTEGTLSWARDFTMGVLRGPATHEELAWRIVAGLPGTTMGPTQIDDPADLGALVAYVRSLLPKGAADRLVHERRRLTAGRVAAPAPSTPDDPRWQLAPATDTVLSPLVWRDGAVLGATLRAVHDGATLAILVDWPDASRDDRAGLGTVHPDAAALQFSAEAEPPLLAMGEAQAPVNIWHWLSFRADDESSELERLDPPPHAGDRPRADVPLYQPAGTGPAPASELQAQGPGAVGVVRGRVLAAARWREGRWSVVFRRAMPPQVGREIAFAPGSRVQVAAAVWNGAAGDRRGEKSISIWQELVIER